MTDHHHHAVDYVELAAPDQHAARSFYAEAFGWTFNDYGPEYSGIRGPSGPEAGGLAADGPTHPLVLIYSDNLDDTHRAVLAAGGTVVVEPFEFPGGRRFEFADPSGNRLGVWGPAPHQGTAP